MRHGARQSIYFKGLIMFSYSVHQTTSTFSLNPFVPGTLALKALSNRSSIFPLASDDVITYTPLPGLWLPHSLKINTRDEWKEMLLQEIQVAPILVLHP